jgi:prepilin-type N-terminal cleavage/methylation domain-containing protein
MDQRVHPTGRGRHAGDHGFTLIEILIAIVLVGILSAVAVLGIGGLLGKAKASACAAERDSLTTAVTAYFAVNNTDTIPSDVGTGVTPMDTIRLAGLINENSKMYAIEPDGALTPIKNNPNHCTAVTSDNPPTTDQSGTTPSATDPSATDPSGTNPAGTDQGTTPVTQAPFISWSDDNLNAVAGDGQAAFTWSGPFSAGHGAITQWTVHNDAGASCQVPQSQPLTCTIDGLTNGTKYRFSVTALFGDGTQTTGSPFIFVTPDAENPVVSPGFGIQSAKNVQAVAGDATATITWDATSSDGGYPITDYFLINYGNPFPPCDVVPPAPLTCTLTGLVNGTTYNLAVGVTNQVGDQTASVSVSFTPAAAD